RRELLCRLGNGFGALGLASVLASQGLLGRSAAAEPTTNPLAPKKPHFAARAKRVILLFMNGGPSHVVTFDPKQPLEKSRGQSRGCRPPESRPAARCDGARGTEAPARMSREGAAAPRLLRLLSGPSESAALLLGPEGGWTDRESEPAAAAGWRPASLGPQILR